MQKKGSHTLGIISDTHGLLRPEAVGVLEKSDLIIHAGDIGSPDILGRLGMIAPTTAVRGNMDRDTWARDIPKRETIEVGRHLIHIIHNLDDLDLDPEAAGFNVVISGHSHKPSNGTKGNVLYINPGSAGPRRFKLPVSVALLRIRGGLLRPEIIELKV